MSITAKGITQRELVQRLFELLKEKCKEKDIESFEAESRLTDILGRGGLWLERKWTGWEEVRVVFRPKSKGGKNEDLPNER